jgi:transposase
MEAWGSHFMARKLAELGHFPKLISPQFVRPFVKSNKNDFVDAEVICEAASRPSVFVQPRTESQQQCELCIVSVNPVQDKVKTTNQMHAFLLEFGISVPRGAAVISRLSTLLEDSSLPLYLSQLLLKLQQHYHYLVEQIKDLESQLKRKLDEDEVGQRLLSIPCVGTLTASTISTEIGDGSSTPAAVTLRRQQGWYPDSTAREARRHC